MRRFSLLSECRASAVSHRSVLSRSSLHQVHSDKDQSESPFCRQFVSLLQGLPL